MHTWLNQQGKRSALWFISTSAKAVMIARLEICVPFPLPGATRQKHQICCIPFISRQIVLLFTWASLLFDLTLMCSPSPLFSMLKCLSRQLLLCQYQNWCNLYKQEVRSNMS